jgi:hypothetical protein
MREVTIVSALFNIERDGMDGRSWEDYLNWFDKTLKLKCPMVLFVTEDVREFIEERRVSIPTEIIVQEIEDIPYYYLSNKIQTILDSNQYKENIVDSDRIECKYSMYSVIQYSKFQWMKQAIEENPHGSDFFFWIDAGGSRFFDNYDLSQEYPSNPAKQSLIDMGESFLIQMNCDFYPDLYNANELPLEYLYDNRSFVLGSMFGGHKNVIPKICDLVENILFSEMIDKGSINNEQIALGYLVKKYPDDFAIYSRTNGQHMDIFNELGKK